MSILDKFRLDGKVAIVTGASKGIGKEIARALGQAGAKVVITSRKQETLLEVVRELAQEGIDALSVEAHNGKMDDIQEVIDATISQYDRIDILVNNAATNPAFGSTSQTEISAFDKIMEVNLKGAFEMSRKAYPHIRKNKGSIINISSIAGIRPDERMGIYSVSKAALISLTQTLAKEWAATGVRVNAICPGFVKTKLSEALWSNDAMYKYLTDLIPMHRMAEPEEMAGLALFLASDASSYCTGGVYVADGGLII
ncbi:MAG: glucose 1-dehydrogenase [Bacteroidetes bacterium]|nr:MAG: glucose 1-dehydrogenase [Bacteroidota bacterium]